ncbi:hypothetical protein M9Y90_18530 [Leptospira interrogans]|uniref:Uncharacterized protein n=2 Tax=Leptospira interrogans TaxID=173 RepID=A0AAQ0B028_LEPIR|nr:hypothetical protein [Leptospira interrogans]EMM81423.1 hypothetical protein LEP1GSC037_0457 [Leptospira interrogans str. 2006001854]EKR15280.1 hypothetical protein LEP1GSC019_1633 [Leptospira interrogans serovar Pyrogenes str. 2006006960]MCL8312644.1 hypothetical protein [Leptospira interrogans]QOI44977.1 hypothetical protein Lepto782_22545 [Leptospira interrogans serovar Canicola]UML82771.1 hypothetical protein FH587_02400 [Leptospira interrogans]
MKHSSDGSEEISEELLLRYVEGQLSDEEMNRVETAIRRNKETFLKFVSIKEVIFLESIGSKISSENADKIIESSLPENDPNYLRILVRVWKDRVVISTSDQNDLVYRGLMAEFKDPGSEPGPVSITRKIKGKEFTFILVPGETPGEQYIGLTLNDTEKLYAELWLERQFIERIDELGPKKFFNNPLRSTQSVEIRFFNNKNERIFSVGFFLQEEV